MSRYVFGLPNLLKQLARIKDVLSVSVAVLFLLPSFCRRYRKAYETAPTDEPLPEDAPAMRPFSYLALVILLTILLVPLMRLVLGLPPSADGITEAKKIAGPGIAVLHLGKLTGIGPLDGFITECLRLASYAVLACLFRLFGGKAFDIAWIAGFFAYVVGAWKATQLIGLIGAITISATDPALDMSLSFWVGVLTLAGTLLYLLVGPTWAWPNALDLTRRQVIRATLYAAITWAMLHAVIRLWFLLREGVLLLGLGL